MMIIHVLIYTDWCPSWTWYENVVADDDRDTFPKSWPSPSWMVSKLDKLEMVLTHKILVDKMDKMDKMNKMDKMDKMDK